MIVRGVTTLPVVSAYRVYAGTPGHEYQDLDPPSRAQWSRHGLRSDERPDLAKAPSDAMPRVISNRLLERDDLFQSLFLFLLAARNIPIAGQGGARTGTGDGSVP